MKKLILIFLIFRLETSNYNELELFFNNKQDINFFLNSLITYFKLKSFKIKLRNDSKYILSINNISLNELKYLTYKYFQAKEVIKKNRLEPFARNSKLVSVSENTKPFS